MRRLQARDIERLENTSMAALLGTAHAGTAPAVSATLECCCLECTVCTDITFLVCTECTACTVGTVCVAGCTGISCEAPTELPVTA